MEFKDETLKREIVQKLGDYLSELTLEKKRARMRADQEAEENSTSGGRRLWGWLAQNTQSISTILTVASIIVSALWTVNAYLDQQRTQLAQQARDYELERKRTVASFASDLSDPKKRNGAAYALSILSGSVAIPLLTEHLRGLSGSDEDKSFRDALALAFISVGPDSLAEVEQLNRRAYDGNKEDPVIVATSEIIVEFLTNRVPQLYQKTSRLDGTTLISADLRYKNLEGANLNGVRFFGARMCNSSLQHANLNGARLIEGGLEGARLNGASLQGSRLADIDNSEAQLADADLTGTDASRATFKRADFSRAKLVDVNFQRADLTGANFSGADLSGASFSFPTNDDPASANVRPESGADVGGASFLGARNVDAKVRKYLCRFGAANVPGGCVGIARQKATPSDEGGGSGCF